MGTIYDRADDPAGDRDQHCVITRAVPVVTARRGRQAIAAIIVDDPVIGRIAAIEALAANEAAPPQHAVAAGGGAQAVQVGGRD